MGFVIYNLFLFLFRRGIWLASFINLKAKKWLNGRKDIFKNLALNIQPEEKKIWFHCASLGEFEQGRPLIEKIKQQFPGYKILLTFFSPSGYEVRKNYTEANWVYYLPMDSPENARRFLDIVQPSLVVFVKYEFWYYYLKEIKQRSIPFLLVSATFRKKQPFFKWYGTFQRKMLFSFSHIFVQDTVSLELLKNINTDISVSIVGDSRFDRVIEIANKFEPLPPIESFLKGEKCIVAGSTWRQDELMLQKVYGVLKEKNVKLIIAPHETHASRLEEIKKLFPKSVFYSELTENNSRNMAVDVLVIDNIGMLSRLYYYGHINYVGGGFTKDGVHNVLEAAVYGKPVTFGPNYRKYREAVELIESGGGISFSNEAALNRVLFTLLGDMTDYSQKSIAAKEFVFSQRGATEKIVSYIQEKRLLTN
jgi:3-deoxy-D-manno-octulosonic-acid transferase